MATFTISKGSHTLLSICQQAGVGKSSADIKRIIKQGGVEWQGKKVTDPNQKLEVKGREVLKFGKRTFKKSVISNQ